MLCLAYFKGLFQLFNVQKKAMSFSEFKKLANSERYMLMLELMRFCRVGAQVLRRGHDLFKTRSFDLEFFVSLSGSDRT